MFKLVFPSSTDISKLSGPGHEPPPDAPSAHKPHQAPRPMHGGVLHDLKGFGASSAAAEALVRLNSESQRWLASDGLSTPTRHAVSPVANTGPIGQSTLPRSFYDADRFKSYLRSTFSKFDGQITKRKNEVEYLDRRLLAAGLGGLSSLTWQNWTDKIAQLDTSQLTKDSKDGLSRAARTYLQFKDQDTSASRVNQD